MSVSIVDKCRLIRLNISFPKDIHKPIWKIKFVSHVTVKFPNEWSSYNLDITLDGTFSSDRHFVDIHNSVNSSTRHYSCCTVLSRTLNIALINSNLQYGPLCWGGIFKILINIKTNIWQNTKERLYAVTLWGSFFQ